MRKLILLPILFLIVALFNACGVEEQFKADANLETFEGILTEQKSIDAAKGTHFVDTDDSEENIAVRSLSINLSAGDYLNNKVKVIGFLNDDGVFEVTGISLIEVLSENNLKNKLEIYKDSGLGFELSYYDNWKFTKNSNSLIFLNSDSNAQVNIEQFSFNYSPENTEDQNSLSALKNYFNQDDIGEPGPLFHKVGIDAYDAVKIENETGIEYTLYRTGFIYKIKFIPGPMGDIGDELAFKQMLAGFKFIGFGQMNNAIENDSEIFDASFLPTLDMELTSFESLPFEFSGKYPSDWYYAGSKSQDAGVLHHYGFSTESVDNENEIIMLDILAGSIPAGGEKMAFENKKFSVFESNNLYTVYVSVDGQNYRLSGSDEHKDLILVMAAGIDTVDD